MTETEMRCRLEWLKAERDWRRGRPLTDRERLSNLAKAMSADEAEEMMAAGLHQWAVGAFLYGRAKGIA